MSNKSRGIWLVAVAVMAPGFVLAQETPEPRCKVMEYVPLEPCRMHDTRVTGTPIVTDQVRPGASTGFRKFKVTGLCNVPRNAEAVAINYTVPALNQEFVGHVTISTAADRTQTPLASWININPGVTIANAGIAKVSATGDVSVTLVLGDGPGPSLGGAAHAVIDVTGYFVKTDGCCQR